MKSILFITICLGLATSCSNEKDGEKEVGQPEEVISTLMWEAQMNDSTGKMVLTQEKPVVIDTLTPEAVIRYLNDLYPNVQLQFQRQSGDTLFLSIPDARYLTQQMGSTGPVYYFATAVYNLTEVEGIQHVRFDFAEGDHASPQTFSRASVMPK